MSPGGDGAHSKWFWGCHRWFVQRTESVGGEAEFNSTTYHYIKEMN